MNTTHSKFRKAVSRILLFAILLFSTAFADGNAAAGPALTPLAKKAMEEADRNNALRKECYEKYGQLIGAQVQSESKELYDLMLQERVTEKRLRSEDKQLSRLQKEMKESASAAPLQIQNGTYGKRRTEMYDSLLIAEERIKNSPEMKKIYSRSEELRRRIDLKITAILVNDTKCKQCYGLVVK